MAVLATMAVACIVFVCRAYVNSVYVRTYILQCMHLLMRPFCIQPHLPVPGPHLRNIDPILPVSNNNMVINLYYTYCVSILIWQCMWMIFWHVFERQMKWHFERLDRGCQGIKTRIYYILNLHCRDNGRNEDSSCYSAELWLVHTYMLHFYRLHWHPTQTWMTLMHSSRVAASLRCLIVAHSKLYSSSLFM